MVFTKGATLKRVFYNKNKQKTYKHVKEFIMHLWSRFRSFIKANKHLCEHALKAMYSIIRKVLMYQ